MTNRVAASILALALALALATASTLAGAGLTEDAGYCQYVQQNMFAGPFKVCEMPIDAARCEELGKTDENKDAVHAVGACLTKSLVGSCDKGATRLVYYEGDPSSLEISCGFQGGTWVTP